MQNFSINLEFFSPTPVEYNLFPKRIARLIIICSDKKQSETRENIY